MEKHIKSSIYRLFAIERAARPATERREHPQPLPRAPPWGLYEGIMPYTPEPLPTYTFKNGAVATIHVIGQMTIAQIAAGVDKKEPTVPVPTFVTDMGAGPVEQPNIASSDYIRAVEERKGRVNMRVNFVLG